MSILTAALGPPAQVTERSAGILAPPASSGGPPGTPPPVVPPSSEGNGSCNSAVSSTPSAISAGGAAPPRDLPPGGSLLVEYTVALDGAYAPGGTVELAVPSVFAVFPTAGGSTVSVYVPPRNGTVSAAGWSAGLNGSARGTFSGGVAFAAGRTPTVSTEKLAVMANRSYGELTVEFHWRWTLEPLGGPATVGNWSVPDASSGPSGTLPTVFFPAPLVLLQGDSGSSATIGTNYSVDLGGDVSGRYIFLELEFAGNGSVVQSHGATAPAGATYVATILLLDYDRSLAPGAYLVHVHDGCGAMLYSLPVRAVFAPSATVRVTIDPSGCGAVRINGTNVPDGGSVRLAPSTAPYGFALTGCAGRSFAGWSTSGGVRIVSSGSLLVSADGALAVRYR